MGGIIDEQQRLVPLSNAGTNMTTIFKTCEAWDDVVKCIAVRSIVFCGEQGISYQLERDEHDAAATHILAEVEGEPVAAGRVRFFNQYAKLERIAVRQPWRGQRLGIRTTQFMIDVAQQHGYAVFKLNAQAHLQTFYAQLGFQICGAHFIEAGIDHCPMIMELPR